MARRITVILDEDMLKKLQEIRARRTRKSSSSVSLSRVVNDELRKNLKQ